jgi:hypothetical protein
MGLCLRVFKFKSAAESFEVCLAKTSYTRRMNDLRKTVFRFFRYNSCHDCVASTFPRLVGQRFPFPGGPRPREPRSPSAIAGSARATTSPSINCPAQAVLGCVENVLVRVDQALSSWSLLEPS